MNAKLIIGIILAAPMAVLMAWYFTEMIMQAVKGEKWAINSILVIIAVIGFMIGTMLITEALL